MNPCDLFTESIKTALGVTGGGTINSAPSSEQCKWRVEKEIIAESYSIGVIVFPGLGLDKLVVEGETKPVEVGERRAIQSLRGAGGACAVSVEVTATSRIDVQVTSNKYGVDPACATALEAARLIEPELP